jgi:cytochrome P450
MRYDPFDPSVAADPYPIYAELRDEHPVHYAPDTDAYVLSRYDDVTWALAETDLFSSDAMRGVLLGMATGTGAERLPREAAMGNLVSIDPPGHSDLRRVVNRGFTPRRITSWHDRIEELVVEMVAGAQPGSEFDIVGSVAGPLPVRVIAELVGADSDDAGKFREWADSMTTVMSGSARVKGLDEGFMMAAFNLAGYLGERIEDRQRNPQDDLLTTLVRAHGDDTLSREEAIGFAGLLLFAGTETTTNLIGNAVFALLRHPAELEALLAEPKRVDAVLEETLRWESPVQYVFRRATRACEIHGVAIPQDATITLLLAAANRDPTHWGETAANFEPDREVSGHVGFGFGPHFCLGAALARAEASIALSHLLPLLDGCGVIDPGYDAIDSMQFRGRRRIQIELVALTRPQA